jgi:hypothetical protein
MRCEGNASCLLGDWRSLIRSSGTLPTTSATSKKRFDCPRSPSAGSTQQSKDARVAIEGAMIVAIVQFDLPAGMTLANATDSIFAPSVDKYRTMPGLIRKNYLFGHGKGGGVYLWESMEAAERAYSAEWQRMMTERFGIAPVVTYFESPIEVANSASLQ